MSSPNGFECFRVYCSVLRCPAAEQLYQYTGKLRIGLQLFDQIGNIRRHLHPGSLPDGLLCLPHIGVCIEASLEPLGVDFPVFIKNVRILLAPLMVWIFPGRTIASICIIASLAGRTAA